MAVHLLLLDPNRARRDAFHQALHKDILVQSFGDDAQLAEVTVLDLAIISLRQTVGHGLLLGKALKAAHPRATVVVYGRIEGQASGQKFNERWRIDTHMPFIPEPHDIAALAETVRLAEQRILAAEAAKARPPAGKRTDPGWRELLTEPITTETLKTLLRKDMFGG